MTMPNLPDELWLIWCEHEDAPSHFLVTDDCNPGFDDPLLCLESEAAALAAIKYQKDKCDLYDVEMRPVCMRRTANTMRSTPPPSL